MPFDPKKKKLKRLVDVDVSHVSLVDRPANQSPFTLIKRADGATKESDMHVKLKNMFGSRGPAVSSVIAKSEPAARALAEVLMPNAKEATLTKSGDVFILRDTAYGEAKDDEQVIHHGSEVGVAYTVTGLHKGLELYDMDADTFEDAIKRDGFMPSMSAGFDALYSTIVNAALAEDTNSPEAFRDKVEKAVDAFKDYVSDLVGELPVAAFKFEKAMISVKAPNLEAGAVPAGFSSEVYDAIFGKPEGETETAEAAKEGVHPAEHDADTPADSETATRTDDDAVAEKNGTATETAEAPAEKPADGDKAEVTEDTAEGDKEPVAAADADAEAMPENFVPDPRGSKEPVDLEAAVAEAMEALSKSLGETIASALKPVTEAQAKTDAAVAKLSKAMGNTVVSEPDEDADNVVQLSKGDTGGSGGGNPPLIDTAYRKRG